MLTVLEWEIISTVLFVQVLLFDGWERLPTNQWLIMDLVYTNPQANGTASLARAVKVLAPEQKPAMCDFDSSC